MDIGVAFTVVAGGVNEKCCKHILSLLNAVVIAIVVDIIAMLSSLLTTVILF